MKRKVIQIAGSTCLISLPKRWVEQNNIKKGQELDIQEDDSKLLIRAHGSQPQSSKTIDITGLDRTTALFYIRNSYRAGYDSILITYADPNAEHLRVGKKITFSSVIHEEVGRLVGVEIIEQKENSCLIKSISETKQDDFQNILRRIFILVNDLANDISEGYANKKNLFVTVMEKHDNITKFISYSLRLLNKASDHSPAERTSLYYILSTIESVVDLLKWAGRNGLEKKGSFSPKTGKIISRITSFIPEYYDIFYKFEPKKFGAIYEKRHDVREEVKALRNKVPLDEYLAVVEQLHIIELIVRISEAKTCIV